MPGGVGAVITRSGAYCLSNDVHVRGKNAWWNWEGKSLFSDGNYVLVIAANEVTIDLQGKTISSNAAAVLAGVLASSDQVPGKENPAILRFAKIRWDAAPKKITIKNGAIDVQWPSREYVRGIGVLFATGAEWFAHEFSSSIVNSDIKQFLFFEDDFFLPSDLKERYRSNLRRERFSYLPTDRKSYPYRQITLENLKIKSPDYGVVVMGAGTVIRNCTIETDSAVGIWSFGAGAVIENNKITVRRDERLARRFLPTDAAIVLQDGHDSVVRGNVMDLEADGVGISLVSSSNVKMSDNVSGGWFRREPVSVREFQ
jgi:Right handed beta helix region